MNQPNANVDQRIYRHLAIYSKHRSRSDLRAISVIKSPRPQEFGLRGDIFAALPLKANNATPNIAIIYAPGDERAPADFIAITPECLANN